MQWSFLSEYESFYYRAADGSGIAELDVDVRSGEEALVAILSLSLYNFVKEKKKIVRDPAMEMQLWVSTEGGVCVPCTVQGLWNPFILVQELGV